MKKIGIIYGGRSTEHDASLKSQENFYNNLDKGIFDIKELIFVDREGKIFFNGEEISFGNLIDKIQRNSDISYLNLLHGQEGEDGSWSGVFDICDIKGTFETVNTSSILMNKYQQSSVVFSLSSDLLIPVTKIVKKEDLLPFLVVVITAKAPTGTNDDYK